MIIWIASYPKSGNTWLRAFLTNLLREADAGPADINELVGGPIASAREPFDELVGYNSADLTHEEVEVIRPDLYRHRAAEPGRVYCKVHDAYTYLPSGEPLLPTDATEAAVYLVRNPLDVCVSWAHHRGHGNYGRVVGDMADPGFVLNGTAGSPSAQLPQRLLSWSGHVSTWLSAPLQLHVMRFEDMVTKSERTFAEAARFLGLPADAPSVGRALDLSRFDEMRRQESERGFRERTARSEQFFRSGRIGEGNQRLTPEQASSINATHEAMMRRLGYLNAETESIG